MSTESKPSFLVIILQLDSVIDAVNTRYESTKDTVITNVIKSLIIFANSYSLIHRRNRLVIITTLNNDCTVVFPKLDSSNSNEDNKFIPVHHSLSSTIGNELKIIFDRYITENNSDLSSNSTNNLSQALSLALTILNKEQLKYKVQSRILTLQFNRDSNENYNALMNCIFSAQKLNVMMDAFVLAPFDSHLLQQACFLTGGIYYKHGEICDTLQILLMYFLSDGETRKHLNLPLQKSVDFKAACYCHQRPTEFAYMCSVCLTLTCETHSKCPVCGTVARSSVH